MSRASNRYAKAILDIAHAKGVAGEVNTDMIRIASTLKDSRELTSFLASPTIKSELKQNALLEVFAGVGEATVSLFRLLLENKRFELLEESAAEYTRLFEEMNGIERAIVTTAHPMTPELEAKVLSKVLEFSNKKVIIENIVNPDIVGGFILRIGDRQFNASIANKLTNLKRELSN